MRSGSVSRGATSRRAATPPIPAERAPGRAPGGGAVIGTKRAGIVAGFRGPWPRSSGTLLGDVLLALRLLTSGQGQATFVSWHPPGSVVAPGRVTRSPRVARAGKPMPAAGETAHVRRLLVD